MNICITGSNGFVGRNLCEFLKQNSNYRLYKIDLHNSKQELEEALINAEIIFHLAGVNRPESEKEFWEGNVEFTKSICDFLIRNQLNPKIVFSSSIQAELNNPYGKSKRAAEQALKQYCDTSGASCTVYRLKNLFGKWCRPNYNAVTATFCHNIAYNLPIQISDPDHTIELTYIDDVIHAFIHEIFESDTGKGFSFGSELPSYKITLGLLADKIKSYRDLRSTLIIPDFSNFFERALYTTYLCYLDEDNFSYHLEKKTDERGNLAEFVKSQYGGQIFVSHTKPGITRGNHYHHTKTEKFLVLEGRARIRFRHIEREDIIIYDVSGQDYQVLDIPPGYTHSIENTGNTDLVTLFWASEIFDPDHPDTYYDEVIKKD